MAPGTTFGVGLFRVAPRCHARRTTTIANSKCHGVFHALSNFPSFGAVMGALAPQGVFLWVSTLMDGGSEQTTRPRGPKLFSLLSRPAVWQAGKAPNAPNVPNPPNPPGLA